MVINLRGCMYDIIRDIAIEHFKMKSIMANDLVVNQHSLEYYKHYQKEVKANLSLENQALSQSPNVMKNKNNLVVESNQQQSGIHGSPKVSQSYSFDSKR